MPDVRRRELIALLSDFMSTRRVTDRAMEAWYHPSIARMTPNRRVTWQASSNDENS
jgi:hypothetical protein